MKNDSDVLVIGGGAVGVCAAYYLAEQGLSVSIVEKGEIASGCSGANAGLIVPSFSIPLAAPGTLGQLFRWLLNPKSLFYVKPRFNLALFRWLGQFQKASRPQKMLQGLRVLRALNYASSELYEQLIESESLDCNYRKDGWLMVYKTEKDFQKAVKEAHLLQAHDIEVKVLSREETLTMEPAFRVKLSGGIFFPEDAHLDPAKFVQALAERLREKGVEIHLQTEVLGMETAQGRIAAVRTTQGEFRSKYVVLAAGVWSSNLVCNLGCDLPVQPAKGYSVSVRRPESCPRAPLYLSEAKVVVTPLEDSLRLAGMMELAGLNHRISQHRVKAIRHAAQGYFGQAENLDIIEVKCGLRPCSPDGLPIIDRYPGYNNLFITTGHGMLGITLAPLSGKLISQLVNSQTPDMSLGSLSSARFK